MLQLREATGSILGFPVLPATVIPGTGSRRNPFPTILPPAWFTLTEFHVLRPEKRVGMEERNGSGRKRGRFGFSNSNIVRAGRDLR